MAALATATVTLGLAAPAAAEQVNINTTGFTPPFGEVGNTATFSGTSNNVTVNVLASAWTATAVDGGGYAFAPSYLGKGPLGLGVTSADELLTNGMFRFDRVDNNNGFDFVLLQFDRAVAITSAILNETSLLNGMADNESSIGAGMTSLPWDTRLDLSDASMFGDLSLGFNDVARFLSPNIFTRPDVPFNLDGLTGNVWMIGANLHNDDTVTFGDTSSPSFDAFNIQRLTVTTAGAVPEPATWAMMIVGFGAIGLTMRRKTARKNMAIA
jgi:hypothetical protein